MLKNFQISMLHFASNWFIWYFSQLWNILMWDSCHIEYWVEVFRSNRSVVSIMQKLPLISCKTLQNFAKKWPIIFWPDFLAPLYFQNKARYTTNIIYTISCSVFLAKVIFFAPILIMNAKLCCRFLPLWTSKVWKESYKAVFNMDQIRIQAIITSINSLFNRLIRWPELKSFWNIPIE